MLGNIFKPIFKATLNPNKYPDIYRLLLTLSRFDCVDDESEYEILILQQLTLPPNDWTFNNNPPYIYYLYYFHANIQNLNVLRASLNMITFQFKSHCGERCKVDHLIAGFLLTNGICHGIKLNEYPLINFLYYMA